MDAISRIEVVLGDITTMKVDAIVNAANNSLLGGGGVDGAIHWAAGPGLLDECRKIGGCPTGEARITGGYNLYAKNVIHTVGPVYSGTERDAEQLRNCYLNCLVLASEKGLTSIAFPAISCGVYGYPISEACIIAVDAVTAYIDDVCSIKKVLFVLFSERDAAIYRSVIQDRA